MTLCEDTILRRTELGCAELLCPAHDLTDLQHTLLSVVTGHTSLAQLFRERAAEAAQAALDLQEFGLVQEARPEDEMAYPWRMRPVVGNAAARF